VVNSKLFKKILLFLYNRSEEWEELVSLWEKFAHANGERFLDENDDVYGYAKLLFGWLPMGKAKPKNPIQKLCRAQYFSKRGIDKRKREISQLAQL
jgi:hypothetical protein